MSQPSSLFVVDSDVRSLETLTFGFEREGCKVTGTSDLRRAEQLLRTSGADLAVVALREPEQPSLDAVVALRGAAKDLPIVALGPQSLKADAIRAGAADYLTLPTFLRDVIGVGKLSTLGTKTGATNGGNGQKKSGDDGEELQTRLSEYYGLFYLLRAMASSERSGVVTLTRGTRRAELRIHEGTVVSASVGAMQGLPALHHILLWEEAALSLTRRPIPKLSQMHLSAQEILDECERFLRDFAHAARDLGAPRTLYVQAGEPVAELRGLQQSQITPLLRLFDGRRVLADVIEASPFRIFDTVRMIRRLRDAGVLAIRPEQAGHDRQGNQGIQGNQGNQGNQAPPASGVLAPARNGAPKSMLEQWAMVPDQRGVVGDRRSTSRKLRPLDVPVSAPIPLTAKKGASAAGEIAATNRSPTPAAANLAVAPTVQVQLDAAGVPVGEPMVPADPASFPPSQTPPPVRARGGTGPQVPLEDAPPPRAATPIPARPRADSGRQVPLDAPPPRSGRTPIPIRTRSGSGRQAPLEDAPLPKSERSSERAERTPRPRKISGDAPTIAGDEFDAIEADFFAREADLYKREAIETFDDLDPVAGIPGHKPRKR